MYEVLVFGFSLSARTIYDYLDECLPIRIGYKVSSHNIIGKTDKEVEEIVLNAMRKYIGVVDVIVIADPLVVTLMREKILKEWPRQKFVWYGYGISEVVNNEEKVCILAPRRIRRLKEYQKMKSEIQNVKSIIEPDCDKWISLIEHGWIRYDELKKELENIRGYKIVVYSSIMMTRENSLINLVGWRAEMADLKQSLATKVKQAMGMHY